MASSSCCCTPGKSMLARLAASPLMSPASPSTNTARSACFAAVTASANPAVELSVIPQPFAYTTLTLPARCLIPSRGVTAAGPRSERRDFVVGEGADHGDGRHTRCQRQPLCVVLEEDDRFFGHAK